MSGPSKSSSSPDYDQADRPHHLQAGRLRHSSTKRKIVMLAVAGAFIVVVVALVAFNARHRPPVTHGQLGEDAIPLSGPMPKDGTVNFANAMFRVFYVLGTGITGYRVTPKGSVENVNVADWRDLGCRADSGAISKSGKWMYLGCTATWMGHELKTTVMPCKLAADGWITPLPNQKVATGQAPFGMVVAPNGKSLYVSTNAGIYQYEFDNAGLPVPMKPAVVPGVIGSLTTFSSDGRFAYATNYTKRRIYQMSVAADGHLHPLSPPNIETGPGPMEPRFDPHGRFLWCVSNIGEYVERFEVQPDGTLKRLSQAAGGLGHQATSLQISRDGRYAYIARYRYNSILQFTIEEDGTFKPNTPYSEPGAFSPATFRLDPSGQYGFALNFQQAILSMYAVNANGTLDSANPAQLLMGEKAHDIIFVTRK